MNTLKRFVRTHAGRGTLGVYLACLLIAWPPSLSWMVAACVLWWSIRHLRMAFRWLDAESQPWPAAFVLREGAAPALVPIFAGTGDALDMATQLDMAARGNHTGVVVASWDITPSATPACDEDADWQRQSA
jgi:hypothetical protein